MSVGVRPATAVLAIAMLVSGCATAEHYASDTAKSLEEQFFAIANASASHDYARALQQLSRLQLADDAAWMNGAITRPRHDAIATAIGQVRADLTLLQTEAEVRTLQQRRTTLLSHTTAPTGGAHPHGKHDGGHAGDGQSGD